MYKMMYYRSDGVQSDAKEAAAPVAHDQGAERGEE
jgi:hypothetical protein